MLLLLLQGPALYLPVAEAASIENAIAQPVGMAHHFTSDSQIYSSAEATAHFPDSAKPVAESGLVVKSHDLRRMATIAVSPGPGTLQTAINSATAGDILVLADGTYTGSGGNVIEISKDITIRAQNSGQAILDGENARRVIYISGGNVVLEGLKITKGSASVRRHTLRPPHLCLLNFLGDVLLTPLHPTPLSLKRHHTPLPSPRWGVRFY